MMRVVTIILGVLLVASGFYCMFTPVATYSALSVVIGMSMVVEGVAGIVVWSDLRKRGLADGWTLAEAILSIVFGVFLLGSFFLQFAVDMFIAYVIAIWLVFAGIARITAAIAARKMQDQTGTSASGWVIQLVLGILIVILGILCVFNPLSIMVSVGMMLGMSIVFVGVELVLRSFEM